MHLSIDTWSIPAKALIEKDLSESGLRIIKRNLEGHLIKVKSGEYENVAVGFMELVTKIKCSGVREFE